MDNVTTILQHLREKDTYDDYYISRVEAYMKGHPDLAAEFVHYLPKGMIIDSCITVNGYSIRRLGATTMLSRSAIYVALARMSEGDDPEKVIAEELENLAQHKKARRR